MKVSRELHHAQSRQNVSNDVTMHDCQLALQTGLADSERPCPKMRMQQPESFLNARDFCCGAIQSEVADVRCCNSHSYSCGLS